MKSFRSALARASLGLALASAVVIPLSAGVASASGDEAVLEIEGGGWGHGRGLGQYGAEGYARDQGWSSDQILDHFYGNTSQGPPPSNLSLDPNRVRVDLQFMHGRATTVSLASGIIGVFDATGSSIADVATGAVRVRHTGSGFAISTSMSCAGPWSDPQVVTTPAVALRSLPGGSPPGSFGGEPGTLMRVCGTSQSTWYGGELRTVVSGGAQRTVNVVSIEEYLRGVVPNEMPASWSSAALEAQSVAARSYALAGDTRWQPWADTCDTIWCQVYDGRFTTRGSSSVRGSTHERTDAAIAATAGMVRLYDSGSVARTEFSSSTGGHTAGGDFPAVVDDGDDVSINPNHRWSASLTSSSLEGRYGLGPLTGAGVTARNGAGPWGGRVVELRLDFESGSRTISGDDARRSFGLKSDLFNVEFLDPTSATTNSDTSTSDVSDEAVLAEIELLFDRLADRSPEPAELELWQSAYGADQVDAGRRLVSDLVRGEDFAGDLVQDLYRRAFGRSPAEVGLAYWRSRLVASPGFGVDSVGTSFFASPEFYRRAGGTNDAFVEALYDKILGRPAADSGRRHWVGLLDTGSSSRRSVAASFFRSAESEKTRAQALHQRILDEEPSRSELAETASIIAKAGDLAAADRLAHRLLGAVEES